MSKFRVFVFVLFLLNAGTVLGCMCGNTSISEMYEDSSAVVVAKAVGIKPTVVYMDFIVFKDDNDKVGKKVREELAGQEITLEITRWFKGKNRKSTLKLAQPNSTCDWTFEKDDLNKPLLLYLYFNNELKTYRIISCGRSTTVKKAADDLSWLKGLPKSLNRTRISGVVQFNDDADLFPAVRGIKIRITGNGKEYNLISDKNGLYEIWDLPAGKYTINAEMPEDKKLAWTSSVPDNWTYFWSNEDNPDLESLNITLNSKSTAGIDFMLKNK